MLLVFLCFVSLLLETENGISTKFNTLIITIYPSQYYQRVSIVGNPGNYTLDINTADNVNGKLISNVERDVLDYFIAYPGQFCEYNIQAAVTGKGNQSGNKSIYSTIRMFAVKIESSELANIQS